MQRAALIAGLIVALAGCEQPRRDVSMPTPRFTLKLAEPDPAFTLSAEERAQIRPGFDVDALERLLAAVDPQARPLVLRGFLIPRPGEPIRLTVRIGDPSLEPLLDEVWAPMWEHMAPGAIEKEAYPYPGRELARQRQTHRAAEAEKHSDER